MILTWDHLPAQYRPGSLFTFQNVLYADGAFDITYNGLPLPFRFDSDETPSANPWVRGAVPGRGECLHTNVGNLSEPLQEGQLAIVQNYHLDFRQYLHTFMLPLVSPAKLFRGGLAELNGELGGKKKRPRRPLVVGTNFKLSNLQDRGWHV